MDTIRPKTKSPITKHPQLHITQKQKAQIYKMSKVTKRSKLQNVQNYKMPKLKNVQNYKCPKLQNVQNYKISKFIKYPKLQLFGSFVLFLCSFDLVYNIIDKVLTIDATFHSCIYVGVNPYLLTN